MSVHTHAQDGVTFKTEVAKSREGDLYLHVTVTHINGRELAFPRLFGSEIEQNWKGARGETDEAKDSGRLPPFS